MKRIDAVSPRRATTTNATAVARWTRLCAVLVTKRPPGPTNGLGTVPMTAAAKKAAANAHAKVVARFFIVALLFRCEKLWFTSDIPSTPRLRTFLPALREKVAAHLET